MNNTTIVGNVGRDPELRFTQAGRPVCDFSVAVNRVWTDRTTNERREKTTWFKVTVWGPMAETMNTNIRKGMKVAVFGEIDASAYLSTNGEARCTLELTASRIEFLGGGNPATEEAEDLPF